MILVLVAMVVLLVLSSGAMLGTMQELRASRTIAVQQRAQAAAEYGMNDQLSNWPATRNNLAIGAIDSVVVPVQTGDTARVRIQRLTARTFNVVSIGRASIGSGLLEAQRQTSMLIRVAPPSIMPNGLGLLTVFSSLNVQGSPLIDGRDSAPPGWSGCTGLGDTTTAVSYSPFYPPSIQKANQVIGATTGLAVNNAVALFNLATTAWATLVSKSSIMTSGSPSPAPVGTSSTCTPSSTNWGEPNRGGGSVVGCQNYFPIIYSMGDLTLNNGRGQGVLLVGGTLTVTGNFTFSGLVLVFNNINFAGTPNFYGSLFSFSALGGTNSFKGNATLTYSTCATGSALSGLSQPQRTASRSWVQLY